MAPESVFGTDPHLDLQQSKCEQKRKGPCNLPRGLLSACLGVMCSEAGSSSDRVTGSIQFLMVQSAETTVDKQSFMM